MSFRCAAFVICLLVLASGIGLCDNAPMGRYNPQQDSFTTEKLEPPLILSWEYVGSKFHDNPAAPVVADGVCYFASGDRIYALDIETGSLKWKYPQDQSLTSLVKSTPEILDGKLYFGAVDGKLYCLDAQTGAFQWFFETRGALRCPPITQDGVMFLGCDDNSIYTIDAASGDTTIGWSKPFVSRDDFANGLAVGAGMVVGSSMDGNVYFVNASSGKLRQIFRLPNAPVKTSPIMTESVTIMAVGNTMFGLTTRSGQRRWMVQLPSEAASTPATDGSCIYIACHDKNLYCYTVGGRQPALKWTAPAALCGTPLSSPTVADQMVYITTSHGIVSGFSTIDGTLKWRYVFVPAYSNGVSTVDAACSPIVANGALLVLTDDGVLHCFNKTAPDSTPPDIYSVTPTNAVKMSGAPPIKFSAMVWDMGSGADIGNEENSGSATMTLDGNVVPLTTDPVTGSVSYTFDVSTDGKTSVKPLADGLHTIALTVKDYAGNQTVKEWTFTADSTMPLPRRTTVAKPVGKSTTQPGMTSSGRYNRGGMYPGGNPDDTPPPPPGGYGNPPSPGDSGGYRHGRWRDRGSYGPPPPN